MKLSLGMYATLRIQCLQFFFQIFFQFLFLYCISRLDASLMRLERKRKLAHRWERQSELYVQHLAGACDADHYINLLKVRHAVVQYNFMVRAKIEYAGKSERLGV